MPFPEPRCVSPLPFWEVAFDRAGRSVRVVVPRALSPKVSPSGKAHMTHQLGHASIRGNTRFRNMVPACALFTRGVAPCSAERARMRGEMMLWSDATI